MARVVLKGKEFGWMRSPQEKPKGLGIVGFAAPS
jgi:hypothetical protein